MAGGGHQITGGTKIVINNQISLHSEREPGVSSNTLLDQKKGSQAMN